MNRYLKRVAELLLPRRVFSTLKSIRFRNYQMKLLREWGFYDATRKLICAHGCTVLGGPFRGMKYPRQALLNRNGIPILFGTYELELHEVIEEAISKRFDRIIDIGCAEGYYAVGLARRTEATVYAFDCEPREMFYCRKMARLNGVEDRMHVRSWCDEATLKKTAIGRCLIISDCEGYEALLFSDDIAPILWNSDLIIEVHEGTEGEVGNILIKRFRDTHHVRVLEFHAASVGKEVPEEWMKFAREIRHEGQQWLYLTALEKSRRNHDSSL
jgi:SAM-dependent methyltransferase